MRFFCGYNLELDQFLKCVVSYVFAKFGDKITLDSLEETELVKKIDGGFN